MAVEGVEARTEAHWVLWSTLYPKAHCLQPSPALRCQLAVPPVTRQRGTIHARPWCTPWFLRL